MQFLGKSDKIVCWCPPPRGLVPPRRGNPGSATDLYSCYHLCYIRATLVITVWTCTLRTRSITTKKNCLRTTYLTWVCIHADYSDYDYFGIFLSNRLMLSRRNIRKRRINASFTKISILHAVPGKNVWFHWNDFRDDILAYKIENLKLICFHFP